MKIGILKTDALKAEFVQQFGEYPDMFARRFAAIDADIELVTYDVQKFEYPQDIHEVDCYLITGSKSSVYDDEPWIQRLMAFVQQLHEAQKKLMGICFGHQIIAHALGGKTQKANVGWCVGVHQAQFNVQAKSLGIRFPKHKLCLVSSHQDQVSRIAKGAQVYASTPTCPNYGTVLGKHIITVQGHPEFDREFARQLLLMRRDIFGPALYQRSLNSLKQIPADNLAVLKMMLDYLA